MLRLFEAAIVRYSVCAGISNGIGKLGRRATYLTT